MTRSRTHPRRSHRRSKTRCLRTGFDCSNLPISAQIKQTRPNPRKPQKPEAPNGFACTNGDASNVLYDPSFGVSRCVVDGVRTDRRSDRAPVQSCAGDCTWHVLLVGRRPVERGNSRLAASGANALASTQIQGLIGPCFVGATTSGE
jgi:hypothetical protein